MTETGPSQSRPKLALARNVIGGTRAHKTISAPSTLCLYDPRFIESTATYFGQLCKSQDIGPRPIIVDLSRVVHISVAAALVLFANISRIRLLTNRTEYVRIVWPTNEKARERFLRGGITQAISTPVKKLDLMLDRGCPYSTATSPRDHYAETCRYAKRHFDVDHEGMFAALQEAMINVGEHAYKGSGVNNKVLRDRFWQLCGIKDNKLYFAFYDMGTGIPYTMRKADPTTYAVPDHDHIAYAMTDGISSTGEPGRGRGSEDIKRPLSAFVNKGIDAPEMSYLLLISGRGVCIYRSKDELPETSTVAPPLKGTLLEWSLPIVRR